jgi:hypothetical protein
VRHENQTSQSTLDAFQEQIQSISQQEHDAEKYTSDVEAASVATLTATSVEPTGLDAGDGGDGGDGGGGGGGTGYCVYSWTLPLYLR